MESLEAARSLSTSIGGQNRKIEKTAYRLALLELGAKRFSQAAAWCRESLSYCVQENRRKSGTHLLFVKILLKSGAAPRALAYAKDQITTLAVNNGPQSAHAIDFRLRLVRLLKSLGQTNEAYRACLAILSEASIDPAGGLQVQLLEAASLKKTLALALALRED